MARKRREEEEEHDEGSERWLVTYADMLTLLMVLFIVLFAMSTVDADKYEQLKSGLADGFGRSLSILDGASKTIENKGSIEQASTSYDQLLEELPQNERAKMQEIVDKSAQQRIQRQYADAKNEVDNLLAVWHQMQAALRKQGLQDDVQAQIDERGLVVSLVSRHVVFEPNVATLTPRGRRILDTLAPVLARLPEPIEVDGHTNQVKVKPKYYPTDWELSSARSITALRHLQEVDGLRAGRLTASAFGHTKPLVDPRTPGSQQVNKRVDVVILSQVPAETREKLGEIQNELQPKQTSVTVQGGTS
ncbi:flagellar motor protein MotB [Nocardioides sp. CER19]|uniref:flagellar motor protein MotB n=1 Tax=Nocardioides sp. CER19 TaxID=3038538 RepID=UPI00244B65F0|nr:flagellar motor protein MotB [Nocardioides sp. CER19]MDH2414620.1 flagellar motor protein MotB [Nocardioides sp. CER19]